MVTRSDASKMWRATMNIVNMMETHRGLKPMRQDGDEIDLNAWFQRAERIDVLDERTHELVVRSFVAQMIVHDGAERLLSLPREISGRSRSVDKGGGGGGNKHKRAVKKARITQTKNKSEKAGDAVVGKENVDGSGSEEVGLTEKMIDYEEERGKTRHVKINGRNYKLAGVLDSSTQFLKLIHAVGFFTQNPVRKPAHCEYRMAAVLHADQFGGVAKNSLRTRLRALMRALELWRIKLARYCNYRLEKCAPDSGDGVSDNNENEKEWLQCRIFIVGWGDTFHPNGGRSYKTLHTRVRQWNEAARKDNSPYTYEAWSVHELLFDPTDHVDVGAVTIVDNLKTEPNMQHCLPGQLPYMHDNDMQARVRDLRPNQVVKCERRDMALGGISHEYRVVVEPTTE